MDFFKSMLSDDPEMDDYGNSDTDTRPNQSPKLQETETADEEYTNSNPTSSGEAAGGVGGGGLWSFGDLVKTITTRSESVLETYRRDLKEFSSGLRKESDLFREVASRAVKELPSSIEVGASAIDGVLKSTADIISQGKGALLEPSDFDDSESSETGQSYSDRSTLNSRGYSRFESQLNAIQNDAGTYCEDPEDLDDYNKWKLGFVLSDKESEIEKLIGDNGSVEAIYRKVVPNEVDEGSFWCRYFYRIHKLKQQEDMRANLVRRSLTADDEEELSWDVDDDDEEQQKEEADLSEIETKQTSNHESINVNVSDQKPESVPKSEEDADHSKIAAKTGVNEDFEKNNYVSSANKSNAEEANLSGGDVCDEKVELVPKTDENEDLEWDEIGDIGENDEKEVSPGDTLKKDDVLKRLSTAEVDDEDLSWDIEDDDEPMKASSSK